MARNIKGKKSGIKTYTLTLKDLQKMDQRELRRYYSMLRAVSNKRLIRLAAAGFTDAEVYSNYRDAFVSLRAINFSDGDVAQLILTAQNFLNNPASTVRGYKQGVRDAVQRIKDLNPPMEQEVIKTDENGNIIWKTRKNRNGKTVYQYEYVVDPVTGKRHRKRIPETEIKVVGAYDWVNEDNALEFFQMLNDVRRVAGADIRYRERDLFELWSVYRRQRNKDFDTNKKLQQALEVFRGSEEYVTVASNDKRVIKSVSDIAAGLEEMKKQQIASQDAKSNKKRRKK